MILWKKKIDGKKKKIQLHHEVVLISPPKLCFSTSLRSYRTQKTGLAQHANHQAFTAQTKTLTRSTK